MVYDAPSFTTVAPNMLSYRHAFHAGNFADLLKHVALVALVRSLQRKEKPFFYLDTHAGIGRYNLTSAVAAKTGEWREGVGRLWSAADAPGVVADYIGLVHRFNEGAALRQYPGSPAVVAALARPQGRLWLCELHPRDIETLRQTFAGERRVKVAFEDGFQAVKAQLPPRERRGLVLIDPSYEIKEDYRRVVEVIKQGYRRFATGIYALWYPVVERATIDRLWRAVAASGVARAAVFELGVRPDGSGGMTASGMIIVNPPWRFDEQMAEALPWLVERLAPEGGGHFRMESLVGEA